jgi:cytochrome c oxidase subunit II
MNNNPYAWLGLPVDVSTHGWQIDRLIVVFHVMMLVLFVGWFSFMMFTLVKFRARPGHKADSHAQHKHFRLPTYLEVIIAVIEIVLLTAFSFPIWNMVTREFPPADQSLQVRVVAEQFAWNVHYPGKDGVFGKTSPALMNASNPLGLDPADPMGADDITTINQFHVPQNKPIIVTLTSKDVIHSFSLNNARIKQDAIPGQSISMWFEAKQTGDFEIACAQLCGLGHYRMKGYFIVDTPEKFDAWMQEQEASK